MNAIEKYETACKALDGGLMTIGDFEKEIAPLRDVVQVVRCKDCKSCCRDDTQDWYWCERGLTVMKVRPDAFCSYGKRREE